MTDTASSDEIGERFIASLQQAGASEEQIAAAKQIVVEQRVRYHRSEWRRRVDPWGTALFGCFMLGVVLTPWNQYLALVPVGVWFVAIWVNIIHSVRAMKRKDVE